MNYPNFSRKMSEFQRLAYLRSLSVTETGTEADSDHLVSKPILKLLYIFPGRSNWTYICRVSCFTLG